MIYELSCASHILEADVLSAFSVVDVQSITWPLPNAEKVSPAAYWTAYMRGAPKALIEIGIRRVGDRACRIYATFDQQDRGGVAVAVSIHTQEAEFFTWSSCAHRFIGEHERTRSTYRCQKCGHSYVIEAEG